VPPVIDFLAAHPFHFVLDLLLLCATAQYVTYLVRHHHRSHSEASMVLPTVVFVAALPSIWFFTWLIFACFYVFGPMLGSIPY
jgi:hypothetical protein